MGNRHHQKPWIGKISKEIHKQANIWSSTIALKTGSMSLGDRKRKSKMIQRACGIDFGHHIISEKRVSCVGGGEVSFSPVFKCDLQI